MGYQIPSMNHETKLATKTNLLSYLSCLQTIHMTKRVVFFLYPYRKWSSIVQQYRGMLCPLSVRVPRKHFSWTSPGPVAFENGQALIFFRQARKKSILQNLLL